MIISLVVMLLMRAGALSITPRHGASMMEAEVNPVKNCPAMPTTHDEWEKSYMWGVFIDGKDVKQGPHVYDWDKKFFYRISALLSGIYDKEQSYLKKGSFSARKHELDIETIEKIREQAYGDQIYTPPLDLAAKGIMPECTDLLHCDDVNALLKHIPENFYTFESINATDDGGSCKRGLRAQVPSGEKRYFLINMTNEYNLRSQQILSEGADDMKDQLLENLVIFARSFAFLHPFQGGNGRTRNMLLQREIRRLGIGCATMMFNYNKDAFVEPHDRYLQKVRQGLEMFDLAVQTGKNPWKNQTVVDEYKAKFEVLSGIEQCVNHHSKTGKDSGKEKSFGSGGTILMRTQE